MKFDDRFKKLNESVMFNLSLSAKELFHSNFLGYLFGIEKTLFGEITGINNIIVKDVKREYKNIDIEITCENGSKYLIENKVKDIIDRPQLDRIQDKNKDYETYFLFSLLGNNFSLLGEKPERTKWKEIGYKHIISILKNKNFKDDILNKMRDDYCDSMSIMISLLEEDYYSCDRYRLYKGNERLEQYRNIRLHDVFQKYGVSHFVNYFRKIYPKTEIKSTYAYVRNGIMTFSIEIKNDKLDSVDIQIEDGQYRRSIVGLIEYKDKLRKMFESIGWFDKDWKSEHNKLYLSYKHNDGKTKRWYQKHKIDQKIEDMSYDDLAKKIKTDLDDVALNIKKLSF